MIWGEACRFISDHNIVNYIQYCLAFELLGLSAMGRSTALVIPKKNT